MIVLIAESKTMCDAEDNIPADVLDAHVPAGEDGASTIVGHLAAMSQHELIAATGLTPTLAAKLRQMCYEFPNKALGIRAIEAYTGIVFKALQYGALTPSAQNACGKDVRIVSSLYGLLRPDDIIKPYRLDFTAKAAPGGAALSSFWKKDVTIQLVRTITGTGHSELLNLLPADAARCVDWKIVKRFCKVYKADFVEISDGGTSKTPAATKLKTMRGMLLRHILSEGITRVADLKDIHTDDFICEGTPVYADHLQFVC